MYAVRIIVAISVLLVTSSAMPTTSFDENKQLREIETLVSDIKDTIRQRQQPKAATKEDPFACSKVCRDKYDHILTVTDQDTFEYINCSQTCFYSLVTSKTHQTVSSCSKECVEANSQCLTTRKGVEAFICYRGEQNCTTWCSSSAEISKREKTPLEACIDVCDKDSTECFQLAIETNKKPMCKMLNKSCNDNCFKIHFN